MGHVMQQVDACPVDHGFDPFSAEYLADPYPLLARKRDQGPVFYAPAIDMWVVTRYGEIDAIFKDGARFSAAIAQAPLFPLAAEAAAILRQGFGATPTMSNCDPPKHTRIRAHNMRTFSPRRMAVLEPTIRERTRQLVDAMASTHAADLIAALAFPLPALTIFTLIGFPDEDTELLKSWCGDRMAITWGRPAAELQAQVARNMVAYWQYCERFVARRLADPRDDFTSDLLRIHVQNPEAIAVEEIVNVAYGLSFAGHETTTNLIANSVRQLLTNRDQWQALCADPSLIANAVDEVLRFDTSVIAWRRITTEPVQIGGVPVPEGARLMLLLASAGRDPAHFEEPERFDITRENAHEHLAFGKGTHYCLGAYLARLEVGIVLQELSTRLPSLRLVPGQEPRFDANISFRGPQQLLVAW
jgi:cytochrome P450